MPLICIDLELAQLVPLVGASSAQAPIKSMHELAGMLTPVPPSMINGAGRFWALKGRDWQPAGFARSTGPANSLVFGPVEECARTRTCFMENVPSARSLVRHLPPAGRPDGRTVGFVARVSWLEVGAAVEPADRVAHATSDEVGSPLISGVNKARGSLCLFWRASLFLFFVFCERRPCSGRALLHAVGRALCRPRWPAAFRAHQQLARPSWPPRLPIGRRRERRRAERDNDNDGDAEAARYSLIQAEPVV